MLDLPVKRKTPKENINKNKLDKCCQRAAIYISSPSINLETFDLEAVKTGAVIL